MRNLRLRSGREGNIFPIALMAFALVGFLFVLDYSISGGKWPWSPDTPTKNSNAARGSINFNARIICVQDVKKCSDGNSIYREPPACEFAACPEKNKNITINVNEAIKTNTVASSTAGWKTYTSDKGWSMQYPPTYEQSIIAGFAFPASVVKIVDATGGSDVQIEELPNNSANRTTYTWQASSFSEPFPAGYSDKHEVHLGNLSATRFSVSVSGQTVYYYFVRTTTTMWQIRDRRIGSGGQANESIIKTFTFTK